MPADEGPLTRRAVVPRRPDAYRRGVATLAIPRISGRRRWAVDITLSGVLLFLTVGTPVVHPGTHRIPPAVALALGAVAVVPLAWRRVTPLLVLGLTGGATFALMVTDRATAPAALAALVALYTVASRSERRVSLAAGVVTLIGVSIAVVLTRPARIAWGRPAAAFAFPVVVISAAWLIGDNLRVRRAYVAQLEERAAQADAHRASEMQRAAAEERARIARELHDVVAHHVSVIAVQAGAARMLASKQADQSAAAEALGAVESSAREALGELRRLLGVLRHEEGESPALSPQPGLHLLPKLVGDLRRAGLPVELNVVGPEVALPPALDLSAFRIVQEALTNVLKHEGPVPASVVVRYQPAGLEIEVIDSAPPRPAAEPASSGRGLIGMRERVAMFGGELRAGPRAAGGFEVRACLPLSPAAS